MATTKKRINVTLPKEVDKFLGMVAKRDNVPQATKAAELIRYALETEEDAAWDKLASERDIQSAKFTAHSEVLKKFGHAV